MNNHRSERPRTIVAARRRAISRSRRQRALAPDAIPQELESRILLSASDIVLSALLPANGGDGTRGVTLFGIDAKDRAGAAVHGIGDINGDGYDDVVVGTQNTDGFENGTWQAGESYVIFGRADWTEDSTPTFVWRAVEGAQRYELWVDSVGGPGESFANRIS